MCDIDCKHIYGIAQEWGVLIENEDIYRWSMDVILRLSQNFVDRNYSMGFRFCPRCGEKIDWDKTVDSVKERDLM